MSEQTMGEASETGKMSGDDLRVSRIVAHPPKSVWQALLTDAGNEALLGPGGRLTEKGQNWQASDGTHGVTRSFHAMEQVRFTFHREDEGPGSLVDLHLSPAGDDQTNLEIVHSHLPEGADREWLTSHWEAALERIDQDAL